MIEKLLNIPPLNIKIELYKRGNHDLLIPEDFKKQKEALKILTDEKTKYFALGGAAGGGKSWGGCLWLAFNCLAYPGTKWFIGREELKRLTESTLETFYKVCSAHKIKAWRYNHNKSIIIFDNGSQIKLLELKYLPSDPMYERYGSTEYTGGWIEEGGEVHFDAYDTLRTRIGRHLNMNFCRKCGHYDEDPTLSEDKKETKCKSCGEWSNGLLSKILVTCNPKKNWLYSMFYKPSTLGSLPKNTAFLQSLVTDNPKIEASYIESLDNITNEAKKQRLRYGNWDYDNDPAALIDWDSIQDLFTNEHVLDDRKRYLTCDIAMQGSDRFVICVWRGWIVDKIYIIDKSDGKEVLDTIQRLARENQIPRSQITFDNDGLGSYLSGFIKGAYAFVNGSKPVYQVKRTQDKYRNLKSQCYFHFARKVVSKEVYLKAKISAETRELLETELSWVKDRSIDTDDLLEVMRKKDIKEAIGRSPDLTDALMMRSIFDLKRKQGVVITRN